MTQTNHPGNDEPAFSNDKITDMVIHKDDDLLFDEPGGTVEKPDMEEWTGDGVNRGNCWFPIHFVYNGENHTADVQKKLGTVAEYHVSGVDPSIDHLPDPYVVAEHFTKEKYDFPVNETYYPLEFGNTIVQAIEEGANLIRPEESQEAGI
jgi:hypothetical protein